MPLKRSEIHSGLKNKGFELNDGDHNFFYFIEKGKKTSVFTKTSKGTNYKTISDDLIGKMARQIRLTNQQFHVLIKCPLTREEYRSILLEKKVIPDLNKLETSETQSKISKRDLVDFSKYNDTHTLWERFETGERRFYLVPKEAFDATQDQIECLMIDQYKIHEPITIIRKDLIGY